MTSVNIVKSWSLTCFTMQLFVDNDADEFNPILNRERVTKILITTSRFNSSVCVSLFSFFCSNFSRLSCTYPHFIFCNLYWSRCLQRGPAFISELLSVFPNAHYYKRGTYDLKKVRLPSPSLPIRHTSKLKYLHYASCYIWLQIVEYANEKEFTSIIVVHTNRREPGS